MWKSSKKKITKTKKLKSKATHSHKPTKFHEKQKQTKKNLNPKQAQTNKIPWTIETDRERAI